MMNSKKTAFVTQTKIFNSRLLRQDDGDGAAGAFVVGGGHGTTHQVDEFFYQCQTDSGTARGAGQRIFNPVKVVKYLFQITAGNTGPGVGYHDSDTIRITEGPDVDLAFGSTFAEFHAVFNQVDQYLDHHFPVIFKRPDVI